MVFESGIAPLIREDQRNAVVTFVDITERKNRELSLEQSRDYYYRMFENFPSLIWKQIWREMIYFNRSWSLFTGKRNEDHLGVKWLDLIHPEDPEILSGYEKSGLPQQEILHNSVSNSSIQR